MLNTDRAQCVRKKSYYTRKVAKREARRLGSKARAFPCSCCNGWHVGHSRPAKAEGGAA